MPKFQPILRVAIPSPLHRNFDYLPPPGCDATQLLPGVRLRVPFGRTKTIGILLEVDSHSTVESARLKAALEVLDEQPALPPDIMQLARWASGYYHHPLGEVLSAALPGLLRTGHTLQIQSIYPKGHERRWLLTETGKAIEASSLTRAPRQSALLHLLQANPDGMIAEQFAEQTGDWRGAMRALIEKGWVESKESPCLTVPDRKPNEYPKGQRAASPLGDESPPSLNTAQNEAVTAVCGSLQRYQAFLLDGVTGSGKTEVYLRIIEQVLAQGLQALVLVPEIGLTPQLVTRFQHRFNVPLAVLHSGLSDRERLTAWLMARDGQAPIVIGTRSAVFTPLARPGVFIIDEEHDLSLKQQEGFRYSARDVAVMRAHQAQIPIVLGSATPSLESMHNVTTGRYHLLTLPERAGSALHPAIEVLDVRHQPMEDSLSLPLLSLIKRHLAGNNQVLLFLNRRGYAPTLLCHDCGWVAECRRCDARLTLHHGSRLLQCHHCGTQRPIDKHCPKCSSADLRSLGHGTERIEQALQRHFPNTPVLRIDRDSTRRKGALQSLLDNVHTGESQILIGTQMLAKGHHFPDVTLVGILDADQGLFGADFRASERMAQLIIQVAGRAGRADKPGQVIIQTHHPDHPLLHLLITQGYHSFAAAALEERRETHLPPFSNLVLLRAEAGNRELPKQFLSEARAAAEIQMMEGIELMGPVPAPMEKRAGRYRAHLLLQATRRSDLHRLLDAWIPRLEKLPLARKVRWALDVDPMEMF